MLGPLRRRPPGAPGAGRTSTATSSRSVPCSGQQVSVAAARTLRGAAGGRARRASAADAGVPGLTHLFPSAEALAGLDPDDARRCRGRAGGRWSACARRWPTARSRWTGAPDRDDVREALLALPGIGPWTADYVAMRALGPPRPASCRPTSGPGPRCAALGAGPGPGRDARRGLAPVALLRPDAAVAQPLPVARGGMTMWTVTDSPVGELRLSEQDGALVGDRVLAVPAPRPGRASGRASRRPSAAGRGGAPAGGVLRRRAAATSTCRWPRPAASSSSGSGPRCSRDRLRRDGLLRRGRPPAGADQRWPRARWAWPTAATRSRS